MYVTSLIHVRKMANDLGTQCRWRKVRASVSVVWCLSVRVCVYVCLCVCVSVCGIGVYKDIKRVFEAIWGGVALAGRIDKL